MEFPRVKWLTLKGCVKELAKRGSPLLKRRIKQELLVGLLEGAIPFRLKQPPDGPVEDWTPDDFKMAAIGTGGNSNGYAELPIAGDDPEAIAKLATVPWQDYSQRFQKVFLNRFELQRKHALEFARQPDRSASQGNARNKGKRRLRPETQDEIAGKHKRVLRTAESQGGPPSSWDNLSELSNKVAELLRDYRPETIRKLLSNARKEARSGSVTNQTKNPNLNR